jgi:hypothetical protein
MGQARSKAKKRADKKQAARARWSDEDQWAAPPPVEAQTTRRRWSVPAVLLQGATGALGMLPVDVQRLVLRYLEQNDLLNLRAVNKAVLGW